RYPATIGRARRSAKGWPRSPAYFPEADLANVRSGRKADLAKPTTAAAWFRGSACHTARMGKSYFRCDVALPDGYSGPEAPGSIYYEVERDDRVVRLAEVFSDGRVSCESVDDYPGREHELSLVHDAFSRAIGDLTIGMPDVSDGVSTTLLP